MAMTSIMLAGGKGGRLGRDKLSERVGRHTLSQRVIGCLAMVSDEILAVIAQGQSEPVLPASARVVVDLYPDKGALGGIYTGLVASSSFHSLVVACDMPFINPSLLRYLIRISPGFDVVIPRIDEGKLEPLHALYSKNCIAPIQQQIQQGSMKIDSFLEHVKVRYVERVEIEKFDPQYLSFININNETDLERARALQRQVEEHGKSM